MAFSSLRLCGIVDGTVLGPPRRSRNRASACLPSPPVAWLTPRQLHAARDRPPCVLSSPLRRVGSGGGIGSAIAWAPLLSAAGARLGMLANAAEAHRR